MERLAAQPPKPGSPSIRLETVAGRTPPKLAITPVLAALPTRNSDLTHRQLVSTATPMGDLPLILTLVGISALVAIWRRLRPTPVAKLWSYGHEHLARSQVEKAMEMFRAAYLARLGAPGDYVDYAASKGAVDTLTLGLARALQGPSLEDRLAAVLLLGTGGVTFLLLLALLWSSPALIDVALLLALLAAVVAAALTRRENPGD